ncbi:hypothetical protein ACFVUS_30270 [Nocardia sp. NPDC058058]|uniref:hypothetical protein n=1 Tax=Nocardia sp. NPDC058058 TaxID=3346317 RepID=UPI0036DD4F42
MSQHPSSGSRAAAIPLSAIDVRWSEAESAFVARSSRYPDLMHADPWSALAAVEGFIERAAMRRDIER